MMIIIVFVIGLLILIFIRIKKIHHWIALERVNIKAYGNIIKYKEDEISYKKFGTGKDVLIFLPGYGTTSPYLDFKPLME